MPVLAFYVASAPQNLSRNKQRISPTKKDSFIFGKMLDFCNLLWYVVVLTGGATHEQPNKRTMTRKHNTARGQQNEHEGDERSPWVYGKASRGLGKDL